MDGKPSRTNPGVKRALLPLALLGAAACGNDTEPGPGGTANNNPSGNNSSSGPTYHQDVRPLLADKCGGCHLPGGIGPFAFDTYEATAPLGSVIADAVVSRRMPPWGAQSTSECTPERPFKHDLRLSDDEIAMVQRWADAGAPEGTAPAELTPFEGSLSTLPRVDDELTPTAGYAVSGTRDSFRCFVLDPGFTEVTYLQGLAFVPGNEQVVHHAIVYSDPDDNSAAIADADGQYDCFGGAGVANSSLVSAWAPGGVPLVYPDNAAMPFAPGTKFILQIHYHPVAGETNEDLTKVQIMTTDQAPEYLAAAAFIGNFEDQFAEGQGLLPGPNDGVEPEFSIPAGMADHTENMRFTVPFRLEQDSRFPGAFIHAVAAHMHYVGTDMKIEIHRGSQLGACRGSELDALSACVDANCPGASGFSLAMCAQTNCEAMLDGLSPVCGSCMQEAVFGNEMDAFGFCSSALSPPAEVYPDVPAQSERECLLHTPDWNFEWQRFYEYDVEIEQMPFIQPGDTFELSCTYDNSMGNPFVRRALAEQGLDAPRDVVLGEETLDEMCLLALTFFYKG